MLAPGMALTAAQLVGRAAETRSLDHLLSELSRGESGALAIVGEPGIGKTRLLAELGVRADDRRCLVLTGSAAELESDLPFWVFVDALDDYVHGLEPRRLEQLDADARAQLGHVLPALAQHADGAPVERFRMHRAVRDLLETLGDGKPLVLVLDDLHWADSGSIDLLGSLLRRPPDAVLLAFAVRPRQIPERLAAALERTDRAGRLTRLEVGQLSADEARELLGGDFDGGRLRGQRRQPVLPAAARALPRPRRRRGAGRRARAAARRRPAAARGRGGGRRPVRAGARGGGDRRARARGARRARPPARLRPRAADRRAAPLPLPPPARAQRGLRGGTGGLAARRARALRRRRWRPTALRPPPAPTTSSRPRATATPRRSRS